MSASILLVTTMTWPFPAQLAAAFAGVGAHVQALRPQGAILSLSRHPVRWHRYNGLAPITSLRRAIAAARPDMIVPCDDLAARLLQKAGGRADPGRAEFLTMAAAAGAPALTSAAIETDADLEEAMRRFGLPLVMKSDHSWGGEGVAIAHTREAARQAFRNLRTASRLRDMARTFTGRGSHFFARGILPPSREVSAQSFVVGTPATSSIAAWRGDVVGAHHFDVVLSTATTAPASVIRAVDCPQMAASARAVARAFNLSGLFGLDYMRDENGAVHLLEMNARATPTMHLALGSDPIAALLTAAGFPARPRPATTGRTEIALFPREWLRDPASPWLANAFHDVPWDDPAVVRACVRQAPPSRQADAQALLEKTARLALTTKGAVSGA